VRVVFRADASIEIGTGHVMRCLTLADALRARGSTIVFVCRDLPGFPAQLVLDRGYELALLQAPDAENFVPAEFPRHASWLGVSWQQDAEETCTLMRSLGAVDWLVVDHYALHCQWEQCIRAVTQKIMVIDDLADRRHDCDILLDQNFVPENQNRYKEITNNNCIRLVGPKFALLRNEFLEQRRNLRNRNGTVKKIFVFFGGADPTNEMMKAIEALQIMGDKNLKKIIVIGPNNPHRDRIKSNLKGFFDFSIFENVRCMGKLMAESDLSLGAVGTTTWERCCLGVPTIATSIALNQKNVAESLAKKGLHLYLGYCDAVTVHDYTYCLKTIVKNKTLLIKMENLSKKMVDGLGIERVLKEIMS